MLHSFVTCICMLKIFENVFIPLTTLKCLRSFTIISSFHKSMHHNIFHSLICHICYPMHHIFYSFFPISKLPSLTPIWILLCVTLNSSWKQSSGIIRDNSRIWIRSFLENKAWDRRLRLKLKVKLGICLEILCQQTKLIKT